MLFALFPFFAPTPFQLTVAHSPPTIPRVNPRSPVITAFVLFAVGIAGFWAYLERSDTAARRVESEDLDLIADWSGPAADNQNPSRETAHNRTRKNGSALSIQRAGAIVARQLDETAVKLRGDLNRNTVVANVQGKSELQSGRTLAALHRFDQVLAKSPTNMAALTGKGEALLALRRYEEAVAVYRKAVEIAPNDSAVRYNFGAVLYRLTRYNDASEQFRRLVEIDPNHARAQYNLATLAQRAGRLSEARRCWQAFTDLEPLVPSGWFHLGEVWMDYDRPMEAAWSFAHYVELEPLDHVGRVNLGLAYANAGNMEDALLSMSAASELSPCDEGIARVIQEIQVVNETIDSLAAGLTRD